ncbi:MAG: PAS domain S-box protein, partial [Deltaproteobacteria bacterium]|nr:PAS domain S-box protein [Deltaproteobacteria bacterium]
MSEAGSSDMELVPLSAIKAYLDLTKKINVLMRREEVMQTFVDMFQRMFPDMMHCIRIVDPGRAILVHVLADGPLDPSARDRAFVAASTFEGGKIPEAVLKGASDRLEVLDEAPLVFEGAAGGVALALADEISYFGTVHLESSEPLELDSLQRALFEALGHHLTSALRSASNLKETTYLKDYLTKLIDNANAPIVIIDGKRRVQTFNRQLEKLTGYTKKTLVGTDFLELFEAKDRKRFVPVI